MLVWGVEGSTGGIVTGSLGLSESSGKVSHTALNSFSNSFQMRGVVGVGDESLMNSQWSISSESFLVSNSSFSSVTFVIVEGS